MLGNHKPLRVEFFDNVEVIDHRNQLKSDQTCIRHYRPQSLKLDKTKPIKEDALRRNEHLEEWEELFTVESSHMDKS